MFKKYRLYFFLIFLVAAIALPKIICNSKNSQMAPIGSKANTPIAVTVHIAKAQQTTSGIKVGGTLLAYKDIVLYAEVPGKISKLYFNEGSYVQQGALLLELNNADIQAQLEKAKSFRKLKQLIFERNKHLLKTGAVSEEEYNLSETEFLSAGADVMLLEAQLEKTRLKAPYSGIIGLSNVQMGSVVNTNTPIASLQQTDKLKLEFEVPEKYATQIKKGSIVQFTASATGGITHQAKVYAVEPKIDEQTRNLTVRAWCTQNNGLFAGGFAMVSVGLSSKEDAISIPTQAIVPGLKAQKVFIVKADSVVERVVETGIRGDEKIEIVKGLTPGDSVVVGGIMYMRPGVKVLVSKVTNNNQ
jgi:membrane fusion protein (multidrug efflux system)